MPANDTDAPRPMTDAERRADEMQVALSHPGHPYHRLASVLARAFEQAAMGKGRERHANDLAFDQQRMQTISRGIGSMDGIAYQVAKKAEESCRMAPDAAQRELLGAIVYAAGGVIYQEDHSV